MPIAAIVMGWPAIFVAVALASAAVIRCRQSLAYAAAAVATPFSLYLHATPRFEYAALLIPLSLLGATGRTLRVTQSRRSAVAGSTAAARDAGRKVDSRKTAKGSAVATVNTRGSNGLTS
jgi:hypothetical protein